MHFFFFFVRFLLLEASTDVFRPILSRFQLVVCCFLLQIFNVQFSWLLQTFRILDVRFVHTTFKYIQLPTDARLLFQLNALYAACYLDRVIPSNTTETIRENLLNCLLVFLLFYFRPTKGKILNGKKPTATATTSITTSFRPL